MDILPNPWTESASYDRFAIAGIVYEGPVELDASALLKKKSDHRRARGRNGGRTVSTGWDLVDFSVTLVAWDAAGVAVLEDVLRRVGRGALATQDQRALSVSHPYLDAVGISQVTLESLGFVPVQAGGKLGLKLSLKEWRAPAQTPGARAPAAAAQEQAAPPSFDDATGIAPIGGPNGGRRSVEAYEARPTRPIGPPQPIAATAPAAPSSNP